MPPAPPSSNSRLTEKCWTVNCTSMTNSRRVCCLKCKTIRPGAWTCPTCGRGNAASTNVCNATRNCYGDRTHSRALVLGSPEAARELAEAQARSTAAYARSKPRSRPGSNAPPPSSTGSARSRPYLRGRDRPR